MALTPKRYAEVDRQLQQVQVYLVELTSELAQAASTDPCCSACQAALKAKKQIANLRYLLAVAEARRQVSEQSAAPVACVARAMSTAATATPQRNALPAFRWLTTLFDLSYWRS
jgi:hypothetical protein